MKALIWLGRDLQIHYLVKPSFLDFKDFIAKKCKSIGKEKCELDYTVSPKFYTGKKKIEIYIDINIFDNILRVIGVRLNK